MNFVIYISKTFSISLKPELDLFKDYIGTTVQVQSKT